MEERFTLSSTVKIKTTSKTKCVVVNRLYQFQQSSTWHDVFEEVVDGEVELHKTDMITLTVSNKSGSECFEPDFKEPISVVKKL